MTLTELRYLTVLADELHFGRAAKRCNVSQPTLSMGIQKLEEDLGVILFERKTSAIHITAIGEKIIAQAIRVLSEAQVIETMAKSSVGHEMPLRIGAIFTIGPYLFPKLIPQMQHIAPKLPMHIDEDYTANLKEKLQAGSLDVVFAAAPFSLPGVVSKKLYDEKFVVLMRRDHPLASYEKILPEQLEHQSLLILGEGHCFRTDVLRACPSCMNALSETSSIEGSSLETLRHMVVSGLGITILPATAAEMPYYQEVLCVKELVSPHATREIVMAWRSSYPLQSVLNTLLESVKRSQLDGVVR